MQTSEQINELAEALAAAQGEMKNATLNKVNPHFKSKYADLAGIRDATVKVLSKHGLSVVQATSVTETGLSLHTRLLHKSGQWIAGDYPLPLNMEKPQAMGSALTYARRYSLSAICGIASDEDDDANAAQAEAKAEVWTGPMGKTEIKTAMRGLSTAMNGGALGTTGDLEAVTEEYAAIIEQAKRDLPDWYAGYEKTRKQLLTTLMVGPASAVDADNPETFMDK